ncbi:HAMP domain-containing sensor histidine kinase [Nevskia sp.]|uniref:sensor histidine kinase n=1 Tax=Nevskia sp. TaxID=1929292 RepID=UPI0025EAFDAD|nr:HAMP domain-containing sensor histidine kinase [Nevskia sp.]
MKRPRLNLYGRLLVWFVAANIGTLLVSVFVTERFARSAYAQEPDWAALAQSANLAYLDGGVASLARWRKEHRRSGIDGTLYEGRENLLPRPPPFARRSLDQLLGENSVLLRPRPGVLLAGERVIGSDGIERRLIAVRGSRPPPTRIEHLLLVQVTLSLLVIGALGWSVARSISRPVAALSAATQKMTAGDLGARVGAPWTGRDDEIGRLAADFDRMATRIEALVAHERGVLQDVSHELRSPLARLHLLLDLVRRTPPDAAGPHFARAEAEIERLDRTIGEALALSRMEADLPGMSLEPVDLAELLRERADAFQIEADARGVRFAFDGAALAAGAKPIAVSGSRNLLERAVDNLLSNAVKFSPDGGVITLMLVAQAATATITVRDHGPGVPDAERASLFRPFFRGANAARAEGHGLGLAIVDRIVRAHRGAVDADNADGGGLAVSLRLPCEPVA